MGHSCNKPIGRNWSNTTHSCWLKRGPNLPINVRSSFSKKYWQLTELLRNLNIWSLTSHKGSGGGVISITVKGFRSESKSVTPLATTTMTPESWSLCVVLASQATQKPGLKVIKLEYILRLKIKRNDWLIADTCPQAANHYALFWVWEWTQVFITSRPGQVVGAISLSLFDKQLVFKISEPWPLTVNAAWKLLIITL